MYLCAQKKKKVMRIAIIGSGYARLVSVTCFAEMGNHVKYVDFDSIKIKKLNKGIISILNQG